AFASNRSGKRDVWRVALDGSGGAERLTDVTGELGEFRWSPDGRRMAYVLTDPPVPARDARVGGEVQRYARLCPVDPGGGGGRGRTRVVARRSLDRGHGVGRAGDVRTHISGRARLARKRRGPTTGGQLRPATGDRRLDGRCARRRDQRGARNGLASQRAAGG